MAYTTADNGYATARFIVGSSGEANYTSISSALAAASSGDTIFIFPGTYTENLSLADGITLTSYIVSQNTSSVTIVGKISCSFAGTANISGINLQTNADNLLEVTGTNATIINIDNCNLVCSNFTGILFSSSNAGAQINIESSDADIRTTGITFLSQTSPGATSITRSSIMNSGNSTTATNNSAGIMSVNNCSVSIPFSTSGTGFHGQSFNIWNTEPINVTCLTIGGSVTAVVQYSQLDGGSASAISISSSATVLNSIIASTNTNAITGSGTIEYQGLTFPGSSLINTTTQTVSGTLKGSSVMSPTAGFMGELIENTATGISVTTTTATNITSISLTPGVWDIAIICSAANTGTNLDDIIGGISTTSATFSGTRGIQFSEQLGGTFQLMTASVPQFRQLVTSTTTYYLVGQANFAAGTTTMNGRITATRVG